MRSLLSSSRIEKLLDSASRDAQEVLPHLVRRLIRETVSRPNLKTFRIPVGDDVSTTGYDGVVEVTDDSGPYVPKGRSVWEMSTGDATRRFRENYSKREGSAAASTSFVFVTSHKWNRKKQLKLQKDCEAQGKWKSVEVIDVVNLEEWLEVCPATARWLIAQSGVGCSTYWEVSAYVDEEVNAKYGISVAPSLLVGGRKEEYEELVAWLESERLQHRIIGDTVEEAAAFIAGVVLEMDDARAYFESRLLFVCQPEALQLLASAEIPYIVVPLSEDVRKKAASLASKGVRILHPCQSVEHAQVANQGETVLNPLRRESVEESLQSMGIRRENASSVARESKGSLLAVFWQIQESGGESTSWVSPEAAKVLTSALLVAEWEDRNEADWGLVSELSSLSTDECRERLGQLEWPRGPLVRRGGRWDWIAWPFSFGRMAQFMDSKLVKRFVDMSIRVLSERDPAIDMPAEERWTAKLYDKVPTYSPSARTGIAAASVLVAIHSDRMRDVNGQAAANAIAESVLSVDSKLMAERWLSATPILDDLAEAAPDVFIKHTNELAANEDALKVIFEEGGHFGRSPHTYVLWGAERLAWSSDYLTPAVLLLGALAGRDPGGQLSNRPANSLTEILLPWSPSTSADVSARLDSIDALHEQHSDIAWTTCVALLPGKTTLSSSTAKPRWRDWDLEWHRPTIGEYRRYVEGLVDRLVAWAGDSGACWADLVEGFGNLRDAAPLQGSILAGLGKLDPKSLSQEGQAAIADALRSTVNRHKNYAGAKWALKQEEIAPLEEMLGRFELTDPVDRNLWLFDLMPEFPGKPDTAIEERFQRVRSLRQEALGEICEVSGLAGVFRVVDRVERPSDVGLALADLELDANIELEFLRVALACEQTKHETPSLLQAAWQYANGAYARGGLEWLNRVSSDHEISSNPNALLNLALALPPESGTWDTVQQWGEHVDRVFWERTTISVLRDEEADAERAIKSLLVAGRPYRALQVACLAEFRPKETTKGPKVVPPDLMVGILQSLLKQALDDEWYPPDRGSISHYVETLFKLLDESSVDVAQIVQLEFPLLPLLENTERGPRQLIEAVKSVPTVFVDLLKLVYRAEDEDEGKPSERNPAASRLAYSLLSNLRDVPGTLRKDVSEEEPLKNRFDGDIAFAIGEIDADYLAAWVEEARRLAAECSRLEVCDVHIGQLLASSPAEESNIWPCEAVRGLIESIHSEALENGLHTGVVNKRGVHFRGRGGEQERAISSRFRAFAEQARSRWPRTTVLLRRITDDFERLARREDEESLRDEFQ